MIFLNIFNSYFLTKIDKPTHLSGFIGGGSRSLVRTFCIGILLWMCKTIARYKDWYDFLEFVRCNSKRYCYLQETIYFFSFKINLNT